MKGEKIRMKDLAERFHEVGVVPVVVLEDVKDAVPLAQALVEGGLPCAEVTFRTAAAEESIRLMTEKFPEMLVGAGTVLTTEQVDAAAKPGNRMCDVDLAARNYIEEKGFGEYFTHRTGHSIGLEDHEFGDVSSVNTDIIKVGQCFSVEPGIYLPDENIGVRIEDLVLITEDGCEVLNDYTKELIVVPEE